MPQNPKLSFLSTNLKGQAIELEDAEYTIGRTDKCDICVPDPTVSTMHAKLTRNANGTYTLSDEGSTNGTRVNGTQIKSQELGNNDILQIGSAEILFKDSTSQSGQLETVKRQPSINLQNQANTQPLPNLRNISPLAAEEQDKPKGNPKLKLGLIIGGSVIFLAVLIGLILKFIDILKNTQ